MRTIATAGRLIALGALLSAIPAAPQTAQTSPVPRPAPSLLSLRASGLGLGAHKVQPEPSAPPSALEYPPLDHRLWSLQHTGLSAKLADLRLARAPDDPETADLLMESDRLTDGVAVLRRAAEKYPDRIDRVFAILAQHSHRFDDVKRPAYVDLLEELVSATRARLPGLSREQAARTARSLLGPENRLAGGRSSDYGRRLEEFVQEYDGTEAALLAEVDVLGDIRPMPAGVAALEEFVRDHEGTIVGAKALYRIGEQLHVNYAITGVEPRGADPTDRFLQVAEIVEDLENGFPPCEWVERAPTLVTGFYASRRAVYAPENVSRVIEAYERFARRHFVLDYEAPEGYSINYLITNKLAAVYEASEMGITSMEDTFERLERGVDDVAAVRYLRAEFYKEQADDADPDTRGGWIQRAIETLEASASEGNGLYHRKALATLASLYFYERNYANALEAYDQYLTRYPESEWAWVAMLRVGQIYEASGDWESAASAYRRAADADGALPPARVLGYASAAHASEALGHFDAARRAYARALEAWDKDFGLTYSLQTAHAPTTDQPRIVYTRPQVTERSLSDRVAELDRSTSSPEGALLESGRWLLAEERWEEARVPLERLVAEYPGSPMATEARYLAHLARFERALELGDIEQPDGDEVAALAELEALSREPWTFGVVAADMARAAIMWKGGATAEAEALTSQTLRTYRARQRDRQADESQSAFDGDVAAIRDVVFRPLGGGAYGHERWNAFSWPEELSPFVVVNPDVTVKLPNGDVTQVSVYRDPPGLDNVLFVTDDHLELFYRILDRLGGTERRRPRAAMETPNQPVGPSLDILALWKEFFAARPGHWGGWVLETYPIVARIEFLDDERTRASASVVVGYAGATVVLEKQDGVWVALRLTNRWVT